MVSPRGAEAFRIDGNTLVVLDGSGDVLWKKSFRGRALDAQLHEGSVPVQVADLDGDGKGEVLVVTIPDGRPSELVCFSSSGERLWAYSPRRTVRTASEVFEPPFPVRTVAVEPGEARRIAVTVTHQMFFPTQVALLDARGKLLREYWHSGHLKVLRFADVNHDGHYELYAGGISNASWEGTLVVLDPDTMGGASAEPAPYQLLGFPPGTELGRVFFPHGRLSKLFSLKNFVIRIRFSENQIIVETFEGNWAPEVGTVLYQLSPTLDVVSAGASDSLLRVTDQLFRAGKIDRPWSAEHDPALRRIRVIKPPQEPAGGRAVSLRREH